MNTYLQVDILVGIIIALVMFISLWLCYGDSKSSIGKFWRTMAIVFLILLIGWIVFMIINTQAESKILAAQIFAEESENVNEDDKTIYGYFSINNIARRNDKFFYICKYNKLWIYGYFNYNLYKTQDVISFVSLQYCDRNNDYENEFLLSAENWKIVDYTNHPIHDGTRRVDHYIRGSMGILSSVEFNGVSYTLDNIKFFNINKQNTSLFEYKSQYHGEVQNRQNIPNLTIQEHNIIHNILGDQYAGRK